MRALAAGLAVPGAALAQTAPPTQPSAAAPTETPLPVASAGAEPSPSSGPTPQPPSPAPSAGPTPQPASPAPTSGPTPQPAGPAPTAPPPPTQPDDSTRASADEFADFAEPSPATPPPQEFTGVLGRVTDAASREPILEGAVSVEGTTTRVRTDLEGGFRLALAPGSYTLRVFYPLYRATRVERVVVRRGEGTRLDVALQPDVSRPALEVRVTGRADLSTATNQLQLRRESASVQDAVSAQEIARSPDSAASDAVRRVVGVSLQSDSYALVRGLGGRYVTTLLNGVPLPSTDPDVPGVQLDLFPAALLTSLSVVKSFMPELPGDWAGGALQINTRDFPSRFTLTLSGSLGADTLTHTRRGLAYQGGAADFLGIDDGTRALPSSVPARRVSNGLVSRDEQTSVGQSFPTRWNISSSTPIPNGSLAFSVGNTTRLLGRPFGYLLALNWQATQRLRDERVLRLRNEGTVASPVISPADRFAPLREGDATNGYLATEQNNGFGALGVLGFSPAPNHDLGLTALFNEAATDTAATVNGYFESIGTEATRRVQRYVQRSLLFVQLTGDHRRLPLNARLRWSGFTSWSRRYEPDTRYLLYLRQEGEAPSVTRGTGGVDRLYTDLGQLEGGGNVDLEIPAGPVTVRVGALARHTTRAFDARRFTYEDEMFDPALQSQSPDAVFARENIGTALRLEETTQANDSYRGESQTVAPYARIDARIGSRVRLVGGVRVEYFRQYLRSFSPFVASNADVCRTEASGGALPNCTDRASWDPLPAASVIVNLTAAMALRLSYGGTVGRPLFRELAPFNFPDVVRNRLIQGEPQLRSAHVHNADVRWEWFFGANELVAAGAFFKYFIDPIEPRFLDQEAKTLTYQNVAGATLYGGELEARFSFGRMHRALSSLSFGANVTLSQSTVRFTEEQAARATNPQRPLVGQSPVVANVVLGFAPERARVSAYLYYNLYGARVEEPGTNGLPDVYQDALHQLDAVVSWEPAERFTLRFAARNLLYQAPTLRQGDYAVRQPLPATSLTVRAQLAF